jgi:predicted DCC family thiol-disulfide oxidoreductase YuxK
MEEGQLPQTAGKHLILYDGVCGLCNRLNTFVLPRDRQGLFQFASLQSSFGRSLLKEHGRNASELDTFYVIADYRSKLPELLDRSRAVLFIMGRLGAPWSFLEILGVLPHRLLDWGYDCLAQNRYRFFGRYDTCLLPAARYKDRFIDV